MKNRIFMDCHTVLDTVYESDDDSDLSILTQLKIGFHLLFCPSCAEKIRNLQRVQDVMKADFFPPSPHFEDLVMDQLFDEEILEEKSEISAGFSFKGWVIIGFFVLLSLVSSFFGMNFIQIADSEGSSFLLPMGITIGIIVTCYGAFFIGSHLKELATRFGLR